MSRFVKQLSKPIASRLKVEAARSQGMSDSCASVGQVREKFNLSFSDFILNYFRWLIKLLRESAYWHPAIVLSG